MMSNSDRKHFVSLFVPMTLILLLWFLLFISMTLVEQRVFADTIKGAIRQRIGNYDMEMKTHSGKPSHKYKYENSIKNRECRRR